MSPPSKKAACRIGELPFGSYLLYCCLLLGSLLQQLLLASNSFLTVPGGRVGNTEVSLRLLEMKAFA